MTSSRQERISRRRRRSCIRDTQPRKSSGCFGPGAFSRTRSRISTTPDPDKLRTSCHPGIQAAPRTLSSGSSDTLARSRPVARCREFNPGLVGCRRSRRLRPHRHLRRRSGNRIGHGHGLHLARGRSNAEYPMYIVPRSRRSPACGARRSGRALRRLPDRGLFEITTIAAWLERRR